jgi:hypothetical protein
MVYHDDRYKYTLVGVHLVYTLVMFVFLLIEYVQQKNKLNLPPNSESACSSAMCCADNYQGGTSHEPLKSTFY